MNRDFAFIKHGPQTRSRWGGLKAALALLLGLALALHLSGCTPLAYKQSPGVWNPPGPIQPGENVLDTYVKCTDEEYARYEANGWDAYECDGDKLAAKEGDL